MYNLFFIEQENLAPFYDAAHSRINTAYMTTYFIGGAVGTFAGVQCWRLGGWPLVTSQLLVWSVLALGDALNGYRRKV